MSSVFSNIKVFPMKKKHPTILANGSVVVGGVVEVRFTVMKGTKGVFASLPARKGTKPDDTGKIPWYPEVKILSDELNKEFQDLVRQTLKDQLAGNQVTKPAKAAGESNQYNDEIPY
jgi:hypothetical protein